MTITPATPGDHHQPAAGHAPSSAPRSPTQATVSGGYNPTGTVTFNLYSNCDARSGTPLFTAANVPLVGGVATSAGYTATATGTDYWVATYNGDANNSLGHQRRRARAGDRSARPRPAITTTPAAGQRVGRHLDRRHRPRSAAASTRPARSPSSSSYSNSTASGTPAVHRANEALVGGVATSPGYTATATGTDYWVATYNGDANNASVTSGARAEPVTITPATPTITTSQQPATRHRRHLDRRQGHGQRRLQPDRHGHLQPATTTRPAAARRCSPPPTCRWSAASAPPRRLHRRPPPAPTTGSPPTTATPTTPPSPARAAEPVIISPATPTITTSQQPAGASVGTSIADKATVSGGVQPDRHGHLQPLQQRDTTARHAALHRHERRR